MKKIYTFILLILSMFLFSACQAITSSTLKIEIDDIGLSNEEFKIQFEIEFENEEVLLNLSPVSEIKILYAFKKLNKETLIRNSESIVLETNDICLLDDKVFGVFFDSENYKSDISLIVEVLFEDDSKLYSNFVCVNIYNFALKEISENQIAMEIIDFYKIHYIDLDININHRGNLEGEGEFYTYTYSNPSYYKITIIITLNEGLAFSDDVTITIRGKNYGLKKGDSLEIKDNVLTYIFDDPNWTGIF